jgi:hypothetical protein
MATQKQNTSTRTEEFRVKGENLLQKTQELIKEGNIRTISIKDKDGKILAQFPLTFGVVGVMLAPVFAAIGTIAALVTECTISVERTETKKPVKKTK